jgi:hypothetical protein
MFVLSVPVSNAAVRRVFSIMKNCYLLDAGKEVGLEVEFREK